MKNTTLNIRTTDETKLLLQQAAKILGTSISGFLLTIAQEKAHELVRSQSNFVLDDKKWNLLCDALDKKPTENSKLT